MAAYNESLKSYWSQQEQSLSPNCILSPQNTEDVSKAIEILSKYKAAGNSTTTACQFAIRGAGHSPWAGSANIDNGVTIDMRSIKAVNVNPSGEIVSIGAGARWSDVYRVLDAVGLGVAGGRISDVGVGGLITGGGMSYYAPKYGFVCDQVDNFQLVLASGEVVDANAMDNPDLWSALKGGSNNFGVVTRFDLKTFIQGKIWGGTIVNTIDTLPAQVGAFTEFNNATDFDTNAAIINTYGYTSQIGAWAVSNLLVYTANVTNPPVLRPFTDIKPQLANTMRLSKLSDITSEQVKNAPTGLRQLFITRTFGNDPHFLQSVFDIANETLTSRFGQAPGLIYALAFQPLPSSITIHGTRTTSSPHESQNATMKTAPNSLGLSPGTGSQVLALQTIQWSRPADDAVINSAAREIWQRADALAERMGMNRRWLYLNYAAEDQDPIASYGADNVERLKATSRKFDPEGLFQKNVPGGFKLFPGGEGIGEI
ncbi:MAG: hypothetical protein LQ352_004642 [Teloschistes flavicans]|nr:MAG: hypothetical protein LQ352_004642 [Teloschistes flavicans]